MMHKLLAEKLIQSIRVRAEQGDQPTEPPASIENLEDLVLTLDAERAAAALSAPVQDGFVVVPRLSLTDLVQAVWTWTVTHPDGPAPNDAEAAKLIGQVLDNAPTSPAPVQDGFVLVPRGEPCSLADAPAGLFLFGTTLALKSEYGSNEGRIDAYIVDSGEFFWGDAPQTIPSQRASVVQPLYAAPAVPSAAIEARNAVIEAATDALRDLEIKFGPPDGTSIRQATIAEAQRLVRATLQQRPQ